MVTKAEELAKDAEFQRRWIQGTPHRKLAEEFGVGKGSVQRAAAILDGGNGHENGATQDAHSESGEPVHDAAPDTLLPVSPAETEVIQAVPLSDAERNEYSLCKARIGDALNICLVEVEIVLSKQLWREEYECAEAFCEDVVHRSRSYVYKLIQARRTEQLLSNRITDARLLPQNTLQALALQNVPDAAQQAVMEEATEGGTRTATAADIEAAAQGKVRNLFGEWEEPQAKRAGTAENSSRPKPSYADYEADTPGREKSGAGAIARRSDWHIDLDPQNDCRTNCVFSNRQEQAKYKATLSRCLNILMQPDTAVLRFEHGVGYSILLPGYEQEDEDQESAAEGDDRCYAP